MKLSYWFNNRQVDLEANRAEGAWSVTLPDGSSHVLDTAAIRDVNDSKSFDLQDTKSSPPKRCSLQAAHTERGLEISYLGITYLFSVARLEATGRSESGGIGRGKRAPATGSLTAPMVGVLSDLFVSEGDKVAAYQPLAIVEAMKVMATIEAPFAGTVKRVYRPKGAQLAHGEPIIDVIPELQHEH